MAKHVIIESYSFTPSTSTVVITGKNIRQEQLMLITNTTAGTVIYNFSDPSLGAASYTNSVNTVTALETTTIVLNYNTSAMNATDKLSILTEETYTEMIPAETYRDPVDKLRVSSGTSQIDTDFEYGLQPTKWEFINLLGNRPSAFYSPSSTITITNVTATGNIVTVTSTANPPVGTPIFVQGTLDVVNADGWWIVDTTSGTTFTYKTITTPAAALYDANKTYVFQGNFYTGAAIPTLAYTVTGSNTVTVGTANAHSLQPGDFIYANSIAGLTGTGANGTYQVISTPNSNTFTFNANTTLSGTAILNGGINGTIYPRSTGYVEHRAFVGGVQFSNLVASHGYQLIRQTRRQFRYQAGKALQFSTGSSMKPQIFIDNLTAVGTTVTGTSKYVHGLNANAVIQVSGSTDPNYNGIFTVTSGSGNTFTYTANVAPSNATAPGFPIIVTPYTWYGSTIRIGLFDSQNGFYYEFDGQTLYAVKRSSVTSISGSVTVTQGSNSVTGLNTKFSSQLTPGDYIVIRGQSYLVQSITSDTQLYISPEYRGASAVNCQVTKTINTRYAQNTWNIDKMDGTGASKFNLDLTKMQMFYMDFTWYGAGAIRFGFKDNRGQIIYCHRIVNNNVNQLAYLRSGNLVGRYEITTIPYYTNLTSTLSSATTTGGTIAVADVSLWPANGTVLLQAAGNVLAPIEYISYTKASNTALTIVTRALPQGNTSPQTFTYSTTAPVYAQLYAPQNASTMEHWGTSVIMDGGFDKDKSYVFAAGMNTGLINQNTSRNALISLRLGPSVDSGQIGLLGAREIINRMQLTPYQMDVYAANTAYRVDLVLNGNPASGTFTGVGGSSLSQICLHNANTAITGGETVFSFFVPPNNTQTEDLTAVRDIGNSILGGGLSNTVPTANTGLYPDGPDILTVCATPVTTGVNTQINARISWTEAQA